VGLRGQVAARILKQHGFADVKNLSGGAMIRNRIV
jgi:rhodanese-related sulfurtransferase